MLIKISLAAGMILAADLPPSLKDGPPIENAIIRPKPALPMSMTVPESRPHVIVRGYRGRMMMTPDELRRWNLKSGSIVDEEEATKIVREKIKELDAKIEREKAKDPAR